MEVWIFAILIGIWFSVLLLGAGILIGRGIHGKRSDDVVDKSVDEREPILDSSDLSDVQCGGGDRSGNQRDNPQVDEVISVLDTLRVGASRTEKAALDYSKECIDIAHKLAKYFKGETNE